MNTATAVGVGMLSGLVVGSAFFGALLWTTERLVVTQRPAVLLASSTLVRMALAAAAFVLIARMGAAGLVAALVGFVVARVMVVRRSGATVHRAAPDGVSTDPAAATDRNGGG